MHWKQAEVRSEKILCSQETWKFRNGPCSLVRRLCRLNIAITVCDRLLLKSLEPAVKWGWFPSLCHHISVSLSAISSARDWLPFGHELSPQEFSSCHVRQLKAHDETSKASLIWIFFYQKMILLAGRFYRLERFRDAVWGFHEITLPSGWIYHWPHNLHAINLVVVYWVTFFEAAWRVINLEIVSPPRTD